MRSPKQVQRDRSFKTKAHRLVRESEAFLAGDVTGIFSAGGGTVPDWAWLSLLAHAPPNVLRRYAGGASRRSARGPDLVWLGAVALLAQEVAAVAEQTGRRVEEVQHDVLLDLELGWMGPARDGPAAGPVGLVDTVLTALEQYRNRVRRQ